MRAWAGPAADLRASLPAHRVLLGTTLFDNAAATIHASEWDCRCIPLSDILIIFPFLIFILLNLGAVVLRFLFLFLFFSVFLFSTL
jgi:hypothetical protein